MQGAHAISDHFGRSASLETQTMDSLAVLSRWIRDCNEGHQQKCVSGNRLSLPSRLLQVSANQVRLVQTKDIQGAEKNLKPVPYVALSHCWGQEPTSATSSSNLERMRAKIPVSMLSRTFQDAIQITRFLEIRYIWIDSLCIIQDDQEDWEREAANMGSVYQNAFLTIAAARSADGRGGCFSTIRETPYIWQPNYHHVNDQSSKSLGSILVHHERLWEAYQVDDSKFLRWVTLRPSYDVRYITQNNASRNIVDLGFPLFTRAWFLQERLLSPRVLHFGHMELFWECRCATWSKRFGPEPLLPSDSEATNGNIQIYFEFTLRNQQSGANASGPEHYSMPIEYPVAKTRQMFTNLISGHSAHGGSQSNFDGRDTWNKLIEEYSKLNLTRETDRLPALSGIAAFREGSNYLAGIWTDHLPGSLCWTTEPSMLSPVRRPHKYRAPSFSWASVEGAIKYRSLLADYGTKRKDWDIVPTRTGYVSTAIRSFSSTVEGEDPRGRVKAGYVELEGYTGAASVAQLYQEKYSTVCELQQEDRYQKFYLDIPLCLCRSEPAEVRPHQSVLLLLLECEKLPMSASYNHGYRVMVLVLRPSADITGAYERVGLICPADDVLLYYSVYDSGASDIGRSTSMFDEGPRWFNKKRVVRIV
jgi:hypothetical protein